MLAHKFVQGFGEPTDQMEFNTFPRYTQLSTMLTDIPEGGYRLNTGMNNLVPRFYNDLGVNALIDQSSTSHLNQASIMEAVAPAGGILPQSIDWTILCLIGWNSVTCPCVYPGAKVRTPSGFKNIEDIQKDDIVIDENNNEVKVINNLKFTNRGDLEVVHFKKNCFEENKPDQDIKITFGHPIKVNPGDTEVLVQNFMGNDDIVRMLDNPDYTYSICTENRTTIQIDNIFVTTWAEDVFYKQMLSKGKYIIVEKL